MGPTDRTGVTSLLDDTPAFTRQVTGGTFVVIQGPDRGESVPLRELPVVHLESEEGIRLKPCAEAWLSERAVGRAHQRTAVARAIRWRASGPTSW